MALIQTIIESKLNYKDQLIQKHTKK